MSLARQIGLPSAKIFRRAHIRRRLASTGQYETDWVSITPLVKSWGTLESAIDDIALNTFTHNGITLRVQNNQGDFNPENYLSSLWNGFLTRYRTLVRIQMGYEDTDASDLPTDPTQGIYIMDSEIGISADTNDVSIRCTSLKSVFDEVRARDIGGLGVTLTAEQIFQEIRDHTDGAGVAIFQQFIPLASWSIGATTINYNPLTTTLEDLTTWDLMQKLAEAESRVVYINRTGGLVFEARPTNTGTSAIALAGQGFPRPNIIKLNDYKQAVNKLYTFFRLKYLEPDTSTSYVTAGTTTSVNATNPSWLYGQRVYESENLFINNTAGAQSLVDNQFTVLGAIQSETRILCKPLPQLEIHDTVDVSYHSYDLALDPLWDAVDWDDFNWATDGENFDWNSKYFRIIGKRMNLDNLTSELTLREF